VLFKQKKNPLNSAFLTDMDIDFDKVIDDISTITINDVCTTPKGQKFMIQEISTSPPAPKKERVLPKKRNIIDMDSVKVIDYDVYNTNRSKISAIRRNFNMPPNIKVGESRFRFLNL
jgi:hypothetical protein